jgi:hypothetical protein
VGRAERIANSTESVTSNSSTDGHTQVRNGEYRVSHISTVDESPGSSVKSEQPVVEYQDRYLDGENGDNIDVVAQRDNLV